MMVSAANDFIVHLIYISTANSAAVSLCTRRDELLSGRAAPQGTKDGVFVFLHAVWNIKEVSQYTWTVGSPVWSVHADI